MALTHPPLINATPGDPITSEAWNNIITSMKTLYEVHNRSASQLNILVIDDEDSQPVTSARVTIVSKNNPPIVAQYAGGTIQKFIVGNIGAGKYELIAEADGYTVEERQFLIPDGGEPLTVTVKMTQKTPEKSLGDYFGATLAEAAQGLKAAGFILQRIIDSHGNDLTQDDIKDMGTQVKVLNQIPESCDRYKVGGSVALLVSAKPVVEQRVTVPDLSGLKLDEARVALEDLGLVLGKTIIGSSK